MYKNNSDEYIEDTDEIKLMLDYDKTNIYLDEMRLFYLKDEFNSFETRKICV